jgi:hypothetical protein
MTNNFFWALIGLTAIFIPGCGGDEVMLSSGNYGITDVVAEKDECNLTTSHFQSENNTNVNAMSIEGNTITMFTEWDNKPTGTIEDDGFEARVEVLIDHNNGDGPPFNCRKIVTKVVDGKIENETTFSATYTYNVKHDGGDECANLEYSLPCTSVFTFKATKNAE